MLTVQFIKQLNSILNEEIVQARVVNMQTLDFNEWCQHLADGSTVTAADVAAVMKQLENKLPLILGLNTKVVCSPEGLTFRPKVTGSITQSELKKKLEARKEAETDPEKAALIDVNRALTLSDLTISDCTVSMVVDLPKAWSISFMQRAKLKRVKASDDLEETGGNGQQGGTSGGSDPSGSGTGSGSGSDPVTPTVAAPVISGNTPFEESTSVTMSGPAGASIYYTLDGTVPTSASTAYTEAITLTDTTTVKAIAVKDGVASSVTTRTFTQGSGGGDPFAG